MSSWLQNFASPLKFTIFHPQWLSNRYHKHSRKLLRTIENSLVLDIGSGNSTHEHEFISNNRLIKLDYLLTNQLYEARPDIYGNSAKLPIRNEAIDIALFLEVMEHVDDDIGSLREIHRSLKPQGYLYISTPFIYPMHDRPSDFRRYTVYGIQKLLENNGFKIQDIKTHGNSIVTALQLFNLALLEICKYFEQISKSLSFAFALIMYPILIFNNLLALLTFPVKILDSSNFGYFIIAQKQKSG